ncbi:MAG: hypothetical protein WAN11_21030, partial [Syntrophobacteraceae bacterium]
VNPYRKGSHMRTLIDDEQLIKLVRNGDTVNEVARKMGVNRSAVSKRLKALNIAINRNVTMRAAHGLLTAKSTLWTNCRRSTATLTNCSTSL